MGSRFSQPRECTTHRRETRTKTTRRSCHAAFPDRHAPVQRFLSGSRKECRHDAMHISLEVTKFGFVSLPKFSRGGNHRVRPQTPRGRSHASAYSVEDNAL